MNSSGYLTLVETKLWRNPESRRTVIGQIIDYAKELSRLSYEGLLDAIRRVDPKLIARSEFLNWHATPISL